MGKRGPKPREKVKIKWSPNFAYAIGLLATDGCLSGDGLLIDLTSKDKEQLKNYSKCLGLNYKIGTKFNNRGDLSFRIQFKNRLFYDFLLSIGLTPRKSLTMGSLGVPNKYFFDFLRGCFDGDGCSYSYWDPRWKSSFMFYITFASGSKNFIFWLQEEIYKNVEIRGHVAISTNKVNPYYQLKYAKRDGLEIIKKMYYNPNVICLSRKFFKIKKALNLDKKQQDKYAQVEKLANSLP